MFYKNHVTRKVLLLSMLFASGFGLSSCDRESVIAVKCQDINCETEVEVSICKDDNYLTVTDSQGTHDVFCPNGCLKDHCIEECVSGTTACLDDSVARTCVDEKWVNEECDFICQDGACIDNPLTCFEGEQRCMGNSRDMCLNNQWVSVEVCPYGCENYGCKEGCDSNDICANATTLKACTNHEWVEIHCKYGCKEGKCLTEESQMTDKRLTNRVCTGQDEGVSFCEYSYRESNELGGVCVTAGPTSFYCMALCDPGNLQKYYCEEDYMAIRGDCLQISDGRYAIIPDYVDYCKSSCSPDKGCDSIVETYKISVPYCDDYENYCDGNTMHICEDTMNVYECDASVNETCVQFGSTINCSQACDVPNQFKYVCHMYSTHWESYPLKCVYDDNGRLSWQYNYGESVTCAKGCNELTGLCN